jgi:hypothetical protein
MGVHTRSAIGWVASALVDRQAGHVTWFLDRPVSKSGQLKALLGEEGEALAQGWTVELVQDPDRALAVSDAVVVTSDGWILDRCRAWSCLTREIITG